jgi:hypothetical protein
MELLMPANGHEKLLFNLQWASRKLGRCGAQLV